MCTDVRLNKPLIALYDGRKGRTTFSSYVHLIAS